MTNFELVTAADVRLIQGLAHRVTATRLDLVNSEATFGELAWNWGKGHASDGASWPRRLWFSAGDLMAWGWAFLPHQVRRSDGSVKDVTGANLVYQVHPGHAGLVDEVIDWYDAAAGGIERTVRPSAADEFALRTGRSGSRRSGHAGPGDDLTQAGAALSRADGPAATHADRAPVIAGGCGKKGKTPWQGQPRRGSSTSRWDHPGGLWHQPGRVLPSGLQMREPSRR